MTTHLLFNNIIYGSKGGSNGTLKIHSGGFVWKSRVSEKTVQIRATNIFKAEWTNLSTGSQLRLVDKKKKIGFLFSGFTMNDENNIKEFVNTNHTLELQRVTISTEGFNWGTIKFEGKNMRFMVNKKPMFDVPLKEVSQSTIHNSNDVSISFHQDDTIGGNADDDDEFLVEMGLYVPNTNQPNDQKSKKKNPIKRKEIT
eukprot:Anaeramoba_flamelloidesa1062831_27.p1 GENE.a1062831_27~~a1062831_27.p1  ORF type:complete len:199 (+),score=49.32 a1062831_27:67-663(+)